MVLFAKKRLQVFVSSTFTDLIHERQAAVEAILTAGHIPAGMELFTSGDESQMEVITQWIDESDAYLLIMGGRYGSIDPKTGKSYTQLEYEYALSKGKPLFSCVITERALDEKVKSLGKACIETTEPKRFGEFKELVLSRLVKFWEDHKDIKIAVSETLASFSRREDLIGWVRASEQIDMPALADEIARLSRENADLRKQLLTVDAGGDFSGLSFSELKHLMEKKDLLEFFIEMADRMMSNVVYFNTSEPGIRELSKYGLVSVGTAQTLQLTDAGKRFLNKYEFLSSTTRT